MARSPRRTHDRQFFFKYMSARVATIALTTRKLRWSSPLLFNDPFDVTQQLRVNFTPAELTTAVGEEMAALLIAGGPPAANVHPIVAMLLNTLNTQNASIDLRRKMADAMLTNGPTPGQLDAWAEMMQTWSAIVP